MAAAEPDSTLMTRFCRELLPRMLTDVYGVDLSQSAVIGEDVLSRAQSFAALDDSIRDILMAPFIEEVFDHEPYDASLEFKGAVAVVVRNSLIEKAHANGPLSSDGIRAITAAAVGPLSHLLAAGRRGGVAQDVENPFSALPSNYPRAWACLTALTDIVGSSGRGTYRVPDAPVPVLPGPDELIDAPAATDDHSKVVLSAIDPRFDRRLVERLEQAAFHGVILWISALSRISRNMEKLMRVLEFLIAHDATLVTTNYMLRSGDVWARRGRLVKPISNDPVACLCDTTGLSGAHRKAFQQIATGFANGRVI
jgi:hypothetical protein